MTGNANEDRIRTLLCEHDKHERWTALCEIQHHLDEREFWSAFISVWRHSESNGRHMNLIEELIDLRLGHPKDSSWLGMDDQDLKLLDELPDPVRVYRGCGADNPFTSWSFSTSPDYARWFADHRVSSGRAVIVAGEVRKRDIIFVSSSESEVVFHPDNMIQRETIDIPQKSEDERRRSAFFMAVQNGLYGDEDSLIESDVIRITGGGITLEQYVQRRLDEAQRLEDLGFVRKPDEIRSRMIELERRISEGEIDIGPAPGPKP